MDVKLPNLGEGADSGTVVNLLVKEGDRIAKDQPLLELENEKAVATIPSPAGGVVGKIFVKTGERLSVGQRILSLDDGGASTPAPAAPAAKPAPKVTPAVPVTGPAPAPAPAPTAGPAPEFNGSVAAAPSIRKMADDLGIDLTKVRGTARGGRILLSDVRAYVQQLIQAGEQPKAAEPAKPAAEPIDFSKWGEIMRKPMSSLRKVISRRMSENWNTIPHVTQFDEADVTVLLELRKKYTAEYQRQGVRLTLTPMILKAVVATLKRHSIFNSSLDEVAGEIVFKEYFHLGIAVDTEAGLLVPVIRDVDKKNLVQLSRELEELAGKARERKVSADELKGGTFTISNQGGIGGGFFTPIINKPEVAILGLGRSVLKPVIRNGAVEPRTLLPIALSYDHRLIDGGAAARFIVELVQALEQFPEDSIKI